MVTVAKFEHSTSARVGRNPRTSVWGFLRGVIPERNYKRADCLIYRFCSNSLWAACLGVDDPEKDFKGKRTTRPTKIDINSLHCHIYGMLSISLPSRSCQGKVGFGDETFAADPRRSPISSVLVSPGDRNGGWSDLVPRSSAGAKS